ncbi:hypothetical protein [Leptolyngbya sp. FACHB-261]|uniref:hypothetical protein n=1 Tax=Leptolyngbya sp. FACHB-261 TaxID=2692806 RepID=UPI0016870D8B|nr:hypothetical protein [Leptolyngbya sp. FACHB-261]MBD2104557.1 hypothetical protein [Leptolyngbya sp. FACHB-261]
MRKILFASSLFCLVASWGSQSLTVSADPGSPAQVMAQAANSTQPQPQSRVNLLSAGAEPRQVLRFRPAVNTRQISTIRLKLDPTISFGGGVVPRVKLPDTVMKVETVVNQVDANGDIHYQFRYTEANVVADATVPREVVNSIRSQIQKIVGAGGAIVTDSRGQVKSTNLTFPQAVDQSTRQTLEQIAQSPEQFSLPLPEAAVGQGARWQVTSPLRLGGLNLTQNATYELTNLREGTATLNVNLVHSAEAQTLSLSSLSDGVTFALKSLTSQGQGQSVFRLDQVMPLRSSLVLDSNQEGSALNPGSSEGTPISMRLRMDLRLESR